MAWVKLNLTESCWSTFPAALHARAVGTWWCEAAATYPPGFGSEQGSPRLYRVGDTKKFVDNLIISGLEWAQPRTARCCQGA